MASPILFVKLDSFSVRYWDEAMFAVNAYEMAHTAEYIVPSVEGSPDMYNSKPPLQLWAQAFFIKAIGYNALAIRLPSAIAACLTIIITFLFLKKYIDTLFAWICSLILITSHGFITFHSGRTGDADALLTLFLTVSTLSFILIISGNEKRNMYSLLFFISLSLAFLTKSFASLLFILGYVLVLLFYRENLIAILKNKFTWIGLFLFFCISILYCVAREHQQPGYIQYLFQHDAGRVVLEIEKHKEPIDFYLWNIAERYYSMWFMFFICGIVLMFMKTPNTKMKPLLIISGLLFSGYFMIISASTTKLCWYDMPLYPLMSIIGGYTIYQLFHLFFQTDLKRTIIIMVLFFVIPYKQSFGYSQSNSYSPYEETNEASEKYLHRAIRNKVPLNNYFVYHTGYDRALLFYKYYLSDRHQNLRISDVPEFPNGANVIVSNDSLKQVLLDKYSAKTIDKYQNVTVYQIQ